MKTEEARTLMVETVHAVHAAFPTYESLPVITSAKTNLVRVKYPDLEPYYVEALYETCKDGAAPVGRYRHVDKDLNVTYFIVKG